jgi:hypothetical protein
VVDRYSAHAVKVYSLTARLKQHRQECLCHIRPACVAQTLLSVLSWAYVTIVSFVA